MKGFTLIELIIALGLVFLVVLVIMLGVRIAYKACSESNERHAQEQRIKENTSQVTIISPVQAESSPVDRKSVV